MGRLAIVHLNLPWMISNLFTFKKLAVNLLLPTFLMGVDFQKAHQIYKENLSKVDSGVYDSETNFLFVVLEFEDKTNSFTSVAQARREQRSMAETLVMLKNFCIEHFDLNLGEMPDNYLLKINPNIKSIISSNEPGFFDFFADLKLDSVQLEDSYEKGKVRYVTCYDIEQIKHQLPRNISWPKNDLIFEKLLDIHRSLQEKGSDSVEMTRFLKDLGIVHNVMIKEHTWLSKKIPLSRNFNPKLFNFSSYNNFYRNLQEADSIESNASADHCAYVLGNFPYHPKAFNLLQDHLHNERKHYLLFTSAISGSGPENPEGKYNPHKIILDHITPTEENQFYSTCLKQYADLLKASSSLLSSTQNYGSNFHHSHWKFGLDYLTFDVNPPATDEYDQALSIFQQGQVSQIDRIIKLLLTSISKNPTYSDTWNLLGRSFTIKKLHLLAVVSLQQSIFLGGKSLPMTNLAVSYDKLGKSELSKSMAIYALLQENFGSWESKVCRDLLSLN
jgi:hypothetical protein